MNQKRSTPRDIMIKMTEVKESFKGSKRKTTADHNHRNSQKAISQFFSRNFTGQRERHDIFKMLKGKKKKKNLTIKNTLPGRVAIQN